MAYFEVAYSAQVACVLNFERFWQVAHQRALCIYNSTDDFILYFVNMQLITFLVCKELNYKWKCPSMFSFLRKVLLTSLKMTRTDEAYRYTKQFKLISFLNIVLKGEKIFPFEILNYRAYKVSLRESLPIPLSFPCPSPHHTPKTD